MNEKFFQLPEQKQKDILSAAFRVFAHNDYRHAPMQEIADEARISKSLLFHYFKNKKELYLYLWKICMDLTVERLRKEGCHPGISLFDIMERGLKAKSDIIRDYPDLSLFTLRSFFEKDPDVQPEIQQLYQEVLSRQSLFCLDALDLSDIRPDLNPERVIQEMVLSSEGFLWRILSSQKDLVESQPQMEELLTFWKSVYQKPDQNKTLKETEREQRGGRAWKY